tara:strand:+ start:338 stop:1384 length:1047 start_codon:yes stop_codon:yes gene_type:complete
LTNKYRFCINGGHEPWPVNEIAEWWRFCEGLGVETTMSDSPAKNRELYVTAAACALATEKLPVFLCVSNPLSRHPAVTAGALLALNDLAPGRVVFGIGTGDSALWSVGQKPAKLSTLREYVEAVRALLRGETAIWRGNSFTAQWSQWTAPVEIPILVAAAGPKALRLGTEIGDGLILSLGFSEEDIAGAFSTIDDACAKTRRDRSALEIWWQADVTFADSREAGAEAALGWGVEWLTLTTTEGKGVPAHFRDALIELNNDARDIETAYKDINRDRIRVSRAKELGIYDWLVGRSPQLWGTPDNVAARIEELGELGLHNWIFYIGRRADKHGLVKTLANEVIPQLAPSS